MPGFADRPGDIGLYLVRRIFDVSLFDVFYSPAEELLPDRIFDEMRERTPLQSPLGEVYPQLPIQLPRYLDNPARVHEPRISAVDVQLSAVRSCFC